MLSDKSKDFLNKDTQVVQNKYDHLYKNDKVTNVFPPNARILDFGFDTSPPRADPTSVERAIAELHKAYEAAISELERKIRGSILYPKAIMLDTPSAHEEATAKNYAAFEPKLPQAPAVKQIPKLWVGDEITWEFYVEGYTEKSVSIAIKSLDARSLMLRDGFIVDGLSIYRQSPHTKVGKIVMVRRADVVNGGHKIVYSND